MFYRHLFVGLAFSHVSFWKAGTQPSLLPELMCSSNVVAAESGTQRKGETEFEVKEEK